MNNIQLIIQKMIIRYKSIFLEILNLFSFLQQESDNTEKEEDIKSTDSSDSAIADGENTNEQSISQDEKIDQINMTENTSLLSITNNQTINFGENDPSTTMKDETTNSIISN